MNTIALKNYIFENEKIEFVLSSIKCGNITYHSTSNIYTCSNYNGDNKTAVNVKNNKYINVKNWTRPEFKDSSDIVDLVQYNLNCSFIDAVKYLHKILGISYTGYKKEEKIKCNKSPLEVFTKHLSCNKLIDIDSIPTIDDNTLDEYIPILHIDWIKEGIMPWARKRFGICYSYKKKRIIIPIRHWLTKELVGTNARTTVENYNELDIPKYMITPTYKKMLNVYGLAENYEDIVKKGYVVVFESEKSVLKRASYGDYTAVAIQGHSLSDEQVRILIGLGVDIVIAMDKDVLIDEVKFLCKKFRNARRVYYINDKWDLLGEKESPADKSGKIYDFFLEHKMLYRSEV